MDVARIMFTVQGTEVLLFTVICHICIGCNDVHYVCKSLEFPSGSLKYL